MNRIAIAERRVYHSQLRAEHVGQTRARILDAVLRVMAGGIASVSVPAVAREAGVSIPTVYRHFGTKRGLFSAVYAHVEGRAGLSRREESALPRSLDELRDGLRAVYARIESVGADELAVAALSGQAADDLRRLEIPQRRAAFRHIADVVAPELGEVERDRIARLLVVLTRSSALRTWTEYLGASADEAADDVAWVIRAAVAGAGTARSPRGEGQR